MKRVLLFLALFLLTTVLYAGKPKVCIVLDDFGYSSIDDYKILNSIPYSLTFAVIPGIENTRDLFEIDLKDNKEVIIHFPWEPINSALLTGYSIYITTGMEQQIMRNMINNAITQIPEAVGINNHMGSKVSGDSKTLDSFMTILKEYSSLYFLDSSVIAGSKAFNSAIKNGIPAEKNRFFLDYKNNATDIENVLIKSIEYAEKNGSVIVIGHCTRSSTLSVLGDLMDKYSNRVDFCCVSQIINKGDSF